MESLYAIGVAQSIFAILLLRKKPQKSLPDRILYIWIVILGFEMIYSFVNLELIPSLPNLIVIPFCYGPFLYFYTKLQIERHQKIPSSIHLHLLPAYIFTLVCIVWPGDLEINTIDFFTKGSVTILSMINFLSFMVSMTIYSVKVWRLVHNYNISYDNQFSHESVSLRLNWVSTIGLWILGGFFASVIIYLIFFIMNIFPFNPIEIYHVGLVIFLFSITYFGLHQPAIYRLKDQKRKISSVKAEPITSDIFSNLERFMKESKPYLNRELTLNELSESSGINHQEISNVLNHQLNKNFFTYINEYRVEEAKKQLLDPKNKQLTILAIGYDSGFNSKSSFNSLFKKYTGFTPTAFRKQ